MQAVGFEPLQVLAAKAQSSAAGFLKAAASGRVDGVLKHLQAGAAAPANAAGTAIDGASSAAEGMVSAVDDNSSSKHEAVGDAAALFGEQMSALLIGQPVAIVSNPFGDA